MASAAEVPDYYLPGSMLGDKAPGLTLTMGGHMVLWVCFHCVFRSPDRGNLEKHGHPFIGIVIKGEDLSTFAARPELAALAVMKCRPCEACKGNSWVDLGPPKPDAPESLRDLRGKMCRLCGHVQTWQAGLVK